ncbi:MAG: hypothetical protein AB7P00_16885, partial [Sandaracinaceae bacterium]
MSEPERFQPADLIASGLFEPDELADGGFEEILESLQVLDQLARALYPEGDFGRGRTTWRDDSSSATSAEEP